MLYFLITTCLIFNNCPIRQQQYINGITQLQKVIAKLNITNYKIIIIENNGDRNTFLNLLNCEVFYTNNNSIDTTNKGIKELKDIIDCIYQYNIQDDDFIVKMTGRYVLNDDSEFMNVIKDIHNTNYKCVIKYGSYLDVGSTNRRREDSITGLIGMSCFYVKKIDVPGEYVCVEHNWAKTTYNMNEKDICSLGNLGINICPGSNNYFLV